MSTSRHSRFEVLAHFSRLRNLDTNRYYDPGLAEEFDPDEMDRLLRLEHEVAFHGWLARSLEEQYADMRQFACADAEHATMLSGLRQSESWQRLIPESASSSERQLFAVDLCTLLGLIATDKSSRPSCESLPLRDCLESG